MPLVQACFEGNVVQLQELIGQREDVNAQVCVTEGGSASLHNVFHIRMQRRGQLCMQLLTVGKQSAFQALFEQVGILRSYWTPLSPSLHFPLPPSLHFPPPPFPLFLPSLPPLSSPLGGKVNVKDSQWLTPLHHAAARGHNNSVKELIKQMADVMARDKNWMTPLHMAAHNNHLSAAGM